MTFVTLIIIFISLMEVSTLSVVGWYVKKQDEEVIRRELADTRLVTNHILSTPESFITRTPSFRLTAKYYYYGIGVIPRWSPLHKEIEAKFAELKG